MLCKECKNKHIARGVKYITCFLCSKETLVNSSYSNICIDCSDDLLICQHCGKDIKIKTDDDNINTETKLSSQYHLNWLEIAIKNFKNQNEIVHMIDGNMRMGDFIQKYAKDELSKVIYY